MTTCVPNNLYIIINFTITDIWARALKTYGNLITSINSTHFRNRVCPAGWQTVYIASNIGALDIGDWVVAGWPPHAFFVADCDAVDVELKQLVSLWALDLVGVGGVRTSWRFWWADTKDRRAQYAANLDRALSEETIIAVEGVLVYIEARWMASWYWIRVNAQYPRFRKAHRALYIRPLGWN